MVVLWLPTRLCRYHFRPAWCAQVNVFAREHGVYSENAHKRTLVECRAPASDTDCF